jgi:hypothetical protein
MFTAPCFREEKALVQTLLGGSEKRFYQSQTLCGAECLIDLRFPTEIKTDSRILFMSICFCEADMLELTQADPIKAAATFDMVEHALIHPGMQPAGWTGPVKLRVLIPAQTIARDWRGHHCRCPRDPPAGGAGLRVGRPNQGVGKRVGSRIGGTPEAIARIASTVRKIAAPTPKRLFEEISRTWAISRGTTNEITDMSCSPSIFEC